MKLFISLLLLVLFSLPSLATTYHVRPGASNYGTGDGLSYENAFGSATSFFTVPTTGDDLCFYGTFTAGVTLGDTGTSGNYQEVDGRCAISPGVYDPLICTNASGYCITASGKQYTRVKNVLTQGAAAVRLQSTAGTPCHGCQISDVECEAGTAAGLSCTRIEGPVASGNLTTLATDVRIDRVTCTEPSAHCAAIMEPALNPVISECDSRGGGDGANVWMCYIKSPSEAETSWTLVSGTVYSTTVANSADIAKVISSGVHSTNRYYLTEDDGATTTVGAGEWDQNGTTLYVNNGAGNPGTIYVVYAQTIGPVIEDSIATDASALYDGVGIGIDYGAINGILRRNRAYGNPGSGLELGLGDGHRAEGNLSYGNGKYGLRVSWPESSAVIANNTLLGNALGAVDVFRAQNGVTVTARNNAMVGLGAGDVGFGFTETLYATVSEDFNDVFSFATAREAGIGTGANSIAVDPLFIGGPNPTTADGFRLLPTSPSIATGSPNGAKYDYDKKRCGNPSNIGAFCTTYQGTRSSYTNRTDY